MNVVALLNYGTNRLTAKLKSIKKLFVRKQLQRQHIFLFELNYLLNVMQMDDATMMEEILNRPETTIQQKTLSLLESNSETLRTAELDVIRFEGLRAGHSGGDYYEIIHYIHIYT